MQRYRKVFLSKKTVAESVFFLLGAAKFLVNNAPGKFSALSGFQIILSFYRFAFRLIRFGMCNYPRAKFYCMSFCSKFIMRKETIGEIRSKADVYLIEFLRI